MLTSQSTCDTAHIKVAGNISPFLLPGAAYTDFSRIDECTYPFVPCRYRTEPLRGTPVKSLNPTGLSHQSRYLRMASSNNTKYYPTSAFVYLSRQ